MTEHDQLRERFPSFAAGEVTAAEMESLERAMARDPQLRRDFIEFMNLDSALEDWAAAAVEVRPLTFTSISQRIATRLTYVAAFAAAMLLGWVLSKSSNPGIVEVGSAAEPAASTQATLVIAEQCRWSDRPYYEGQRLPAGRVRLLAGNAVIRLDGGTLLVLRGDCDLTLRPDGGVDLRRGEIAARSADDAAGFVVHTPGTTVVDLGTEFALRVDASGRTEVHVVEGSVRLERDGTADDRPEIVVAERAVRIDHHKSLPAETIAYGAEPIAATLERMRRQQAVQDVSVVEPFEYPTGKHAPDLLNGGQGWQGPWQLPIQRDAASTYPGTQRLMPIVETTALGKFWETPAGKSFRVRSLAQPINLGVDGVVYIGMAIHPEKLTEPAGPFDKQGRSVRLSFRSAPSLKPESISFGFNNNQRPIIETSAGRSFVGRTTVPMSTSVRLVAKVLTREHGEDELSLIFLDEREKDEIEPPIWDVATRGVQLAAQLQDIFVASHGPAARGLDDLRIGATWWSVLQETSSP